MPCDYSKYPKNWKSEIRPRILERAGNKCERCGVADHARGARCPDGEWYDENEIQHMNSDVGRGIFGQFPKIIKIILTIAHVVDPDPMNCADENLLALCQRCHNKHDAPMRAKNRRANHTAKVGQQTMDL